MAFGNYNYNPYAWSNPYAMPQYQPPQMPPVQSQPTAQQSNGIRWVQGEAGAKAYPVAPGESAFLMDSENPMAYLKSTDQSGMPSMRYYSITEVNPEAIAPKSEPAPRVDYATQDDLNRLREELKTVRKTIKSLQVSMEGDVNE